MQTLLWGETTVLPLDELPRPRVKRFLLTFPSYFSFLLFLLTEMMFTNLHHIGKIILLAVDNRL